MQIDFDTIRDEFSIADHISDDVMAAFAENWLGSSQVPWDELEDSFCGIFSSDNEDEAIGDYLFTMAVELDTLDNVPDWIRHNIDWQSCGRDARFNGDHRAEVLGPWPLGPQFIDFAVFRIR
jgi:hypothetical protein